MCVFNYLSSCSVRGYFGKHFRRAFWTIVKNAFYKVGFSKEKRNWLKDKTPHSALQNVPTSILCTRVFLQKLFHVTFPYMWHHFFLHLTYPSMTIMTAADVFDAHGHNTLARTNAHPFFPPLLYLIESIYRSESPSSGGVKSRQQRDTTAIISHCSHCDCCQTPT